MNRILLFFAFLSVFAVSSCIEDDFIEDFVQPEVRITNSIDTLCVDSVFTYEASFFNNIGQRDAVDIGWSSTDETVVTINDEGQAIGVAEGDAIIVASFFDSVESVEVSDSIDISIGEAILPPEEDPLLMINGVIETTTFYRLEGDFQYSETEDEGVFIDIASNYSADSGLPGLYIYLSNNRNSIANALEIGEVTTFNGAHTYTVPDVGFQDYNFIVYFCKPFNVKVGEAELNF